MEDNFMEFQKSIYSRQELEILRELKNLSGLKTHKIFYLILTIIFSITALKDFYNLLVIWYDKLLELTAWLVLICIFDIAFAFFFFKKFTQYRNLIIKYTKINNPQTNPLAEVCNEKIDSCKDAINKNESYYVVKDYYIDLKKFLETYKALLPKETYNNALKDLNYISSKLMDCDLKR